jgi:hypothetical protein
VKLVCSLKNIYQVLSLLLTLLTGDPLARHPCAKADALYFLDTLEHFIPIIHPTNIQAVLPVIREYLQPQLTSRTHLESAHSVFLSILARGDILHDQILPYLDQVYNVFSFYGDLIQAFPQALSAQQVRLAFSTVVKLSPTQQITIILTNLLRHAQSARTEVLPKGDSDEQLTYFFAFVDCLPWIGADEIEFWFNQLVVTASCVNGERRDQLVSRIWESVSGEIGGDGGMTAVEWWVNGGNNRVINPKL